MAFGKPTSVYLACLAPARNNFHLTLRKRPKTRTRFCFYPSISSSHLSPSSNLSSHHQISPRRQISSLLSSISESTCRWSKLEMTATAKGVAEWAPTLGTTYFDRDGDLRLEVGPDNIECVVCPRALSRASPVFKNMLYGGFKESKPSKGEWVVKCNDQLPG